ncbi:MAG: DNA cytosine methyltransferase [Pontimonas sp.]|nr:DNA cytosine methyltransferase [Pontimonas sp.]
MKPSHLDLFCGPGGFATGFKWAGFRTVAGIDVHLPSLSTFARNHPDAATLHADIRDVSAQDIRTLIGATGIDVMSAGVPCEGFSMANRNRTKFTDARNFLFIEFLRLADTLRPRVILVENVANLVRHAGGVFADEIEKGMQDLGYRTTSTVLNALDYGVPQRRRRVMFAGFLDEDATFSWPKPLEAEPLTVGDAILGDLPPLEANEVADTYLCEARTDYQRAMRGTQDLLMNHQAPRHPPETIAMIANTVPGEPMYENYRQRIRLHPDKPSPTVISGGIRPQFAYGHPTQARGLTIRERARLMSFPDSYEFLGGLTQGRVQTGDAVPPLLAKAVASQIKRALSKRRAVDDHIGAVHVGASAKFGVPEPRLF